MILENAKYPELISVRAVQPREGLVVHVTFTDGTERDIDLDPFVGTGPIFAPIRRDPSLFRQVYVDAETETLTWPNGTDIAPETLYYEGRLPWANEQASSPRRPPQRRSSTRKQAKRKNRASATSR